MDSPRQLDQIPFQSEAKAKAKDVVKYEGDQAWLNNFDLEAFRKDIRALGKRLEDQQGPADVKHLNKIIGWSNIMGILGLSTLWLTPNPLTVSALSLWIYSRWAMIAHHTMHGGYQKEDESGRFRPGTFAVGTLNRRMTDWFDWMLPEAWNLEHNKLHHYNLGEETDPDLVERNMQDVRENNWPKIFKYAYVGAIVAVWKWVYYAPNTFKELKVDEMRRQGKEIPKDATKPYIMLKALINARPDLVDAKEFFMKVVGPYFLTRFVLMPLPFALLGPAAFIHAILNMAIADVITNIHAFVTIVPNHSGKDLYRFTTPAAPNSGEYYLRSVLSGANFDLGNDKIDFMHGWLNYQVEHHLWPNLSMLSYQKAQKETEEICKKHGVPYIKENVFERTRKTIDVMIGKESMRVFPAEWSMRQEENKGKEWNTLEKS